MKWNARRPSRGLYALILLGMVSPLRADSPGPAGLRSVNILVREGRVVFVQPDGSITVLDAATGAVRLRTPPDAHGGYQVLPLALAAGALVSADTYFRLVRLREPALAWTVQGCDSGYHLSPKGLVCVSGVNGDGTRLALHSLVTGKPRWTYRGADSLGGEVLDGRGRLMFTFEDWSESESIPTRSGTLGRQVRRVVGLMVLDLATGKDLLPRLAQDTRLDGRLVQPIEFDGERIRYWLHRSPNDSCAGARLRTLTLNAAANAVSSEERCEAHPKPLSQATEDRGTEASRCYISGRGGPVRTRELPGGSVTLGGLGATTLVDVTAGARRWLAGIPDDFGLSPELGNVRQSGGIIFLESYSWTVGRLDALDAVRERPLWTYVFPTTPQVTSGSGLLPEPEPEEFPFDGPSWADIRRSPPSGVFPVPLKALASRSAADRDRDRHLGRSRAAPVILDPGPSRRRPAKSAASER